MVLVGRRQAQHDASVLRMLVRRTRLVVVVSRRPTGGVCRAILVGRKVLVENDDWQLLDHGLLDGGECRYPVGVAACGREVLQASINSWIAEVFPVRGVTYIDA